MEGIPLRHRCRPRHGVPEILKLLGAVGARTVPEEYDVAAVRIHDEAMADQMEFEKQSKELFEVLAMITNGEAELMVRSVTSQDGIVAWQRLYRHNNTRTMARVRNARVPVKARVQT